MSAVLTHPTWCTRQGCAERGWHASRPLIAGEPEEATTPVAVYLVQLLVPYADPNITLTAGEARLLVSIGQARIARRFIGRLVELAQAS